MKIRMTFDTPDGTKIVEKQAAKAPTKERKQEIADVYKQRRGWTMTSCEVVPDEDKKTK